MYITLFETQIIRSFLVSDKLDLISKLADRYELTILTKKSEFNTILNALRDLNQDVKVVVFNEFRNNFLTRLCESVLFYSLKTPAMPINIGRQLVLDNNKVAYVLRIISHFFFSNFPFVTPVFRFIFKYSLNYKKIEMNFTPRVDFNGSSSLFITSLSPLRGEDVLIGLLFKSKGIRVSGTIRSWDNIVQNGSLRFLPDVFLSHGEFMARSVVKMQGMSPNKVINSVSPSYQKRYILPRSLKDNRIVNIAYLCAGLESNPDELNFITWLVSEWDELPINFNLTILQHPSYVIDLPTNLKLSNIKITTFIYSNSSINDYYAFLKNMDLVIGVGTTAILDASFQSVPILMIGFEVKIQNFSASAQRGFDRFPHTVNFIEKNSPCVAKSKQDLIYKILNFSKIVSLDKHSVHFFTGDPDLDLFQDIVTSVEEY